MKTYIYVVLAVVAGFFIVSQKAISETESVTVYDYGSGTFPPKPLIGIMGMLTRPATIMALVHSRRIRVMRMVVHPTITEPERLKAWTVIPMVQGIRPLPNYL